MRIPGPSVELYGENERGALAVALVAHGRGLTELTLRYEWAARRLVWRTPYGQSVETGKHVEDAIARLRALYNNASPEGISRYAPVLVEVRTFPPCEDSAADEAGPE